MKNIEVIAEIANSHQGNPEYAVDLALRCLDSGACAIKFQIYFADELLVRSHPRFLHFKGQSFSKVVWNTIIERLKARGTKVYCDVFGIQALEVARDSGADGYKLHSSDLGNDQLLDMLLPLPSSRVFLSTGGSTAREIAYAINRISKKHQITLMHGFQSYPTRIQDANLKRLYWLQEHFGAVASIGYQDHVDGEDTFAFTLPLLAIAMGASVVEKHVTLDRAAKGVDYYSSLEPAELKLFMGEVQKTCEALASSPESFSSAERIYRTTVKKRWVAARDLHIGDVLTFEDLVMKRIAEDGKDITDSSQLVGKRLLRNIAEEIPINRADVGNIAWALVVARSSSSRLPKKALLDMFGTSALTHLLERLKQAKSLSNIILCTTDLREDDLLVSLARDSGVGVHRGPVKDVLGRMLGALKGNDVDVVVRVTGDDILVDPDYIDRGLLHHLGSNAEYSELKALPSGTEVEYFDVRLLEQIHKLARSPDDTEYLTCYIMDHVDQYRTSSVPIDQRHSHNWRLTLDTPKDYAVIRSFLGSMQKKGKLMDYRLDDIVEFFKANPEVLEINKTTALHFKRPEIDTLIEWHRLV